MTPASKTPKKIKKKASLVLILKRMLATEPVQAPVIGSGIPTKRINPNLPHLA